MIKVQDWIASIPDEDKHIAYVDEGMSTQQEFLLCGKDWQKYMIIFKILTLKKMNLMYSLRHL